MIGRGPYVCACRPLPRARARRAVPLPLVAAMAAIAENTALGGTLWATRGRIAFCLCKADPLEDDDLFERLERMLPVIVGLSGWALPACQIDRNFLHFVDAAALNAGQS